MDCLDYLWKIKNGSVEQKLNQHLNEFEKLVNKYFENLDTEKPEKSEETSIQLLLDVLSILYDHLPHTFLTKHYEWIANICKTVPVISSSIVKALLSLYLNLYKQNFPPACVFSIFFVLPL